MRRGVALLGALALLCAGCGGDDPVAGGSGTPAADRGPATLPAGPTPQPLDFAPGVRAAQREGAVAVVDLVNRVGIEPRGMSVNRQQTLSRLAWSGWGRERSTGRGQVRTLVCEPTCAQGKIETTSAVIVLSEPRRCDGRRFYTRSSMTYEEAKAGRTRAPDTYLRTPPC